jgi:predicted dehydrogenase
VLVEKPLCLTLTELRDIEATLAEAGSQSSAVGRPSSESPAPTVTVGFNRRFSPHVEKMKSLLRDAEPMSIVATMNAGAIPLNHWVHDPEIGGGRLIGEACHFADLAIFLTGSLVTEVGATALAGTSDTASIVLRHANGSNSVVNYFANGHRELSKERVEVHCHGKSLLLDNFRELRGFGFRSFSKLKTKQDKGHAKQFALFTECVRSNGPSLIPWAEIANGARATLAIPMAITERRWIRIDEL